MNVNHFQQYKAQSVSTMTNSEMLLLLLDELVKRLARAELALEKQNFTLFDQSIDRSSDIVRYLQATLNHNFDLSRDLKKMYDFFLYEFSRIKAGRNIEVLQEVKPLTQELRDTFYTASKTMNR